MINVLELLGINRLISTSIEPIIPSITKIFPFFAETHISIETFPKCQDEVIGGFNEIFYWRLTFQKLVKVLQKGMSVVVVSLG